MIITFVMLVAINCYLTVYLLLLDNLLTFYVLASKRCSVNDFYVTYRENSVILSPP